MVFDLEKVADRINSILQGGGLARDVAELNQIISSAAYAEARAEMVKRNEARGLRVYVGGEIWFADHAEELENTELYALYYANMSTMWSQALSMAAIRQRHWSQWTKS